MVQPGLENGANKPCFVHCLVPFVAENHASVKDVKM